MNNNNINSVLDAVSGSLLNDLLLDLNTDATTNHTKFNVDDEDLFSVLKQELMPGPSSAALVVSQHASYTDAGTGDDAWSTALAQFGNMSLAADFLAADKKQKQDETMNSAPQLCDDLFGSEENYSLEEEILLKNQKGVVEVNETLAVALGRGEPVVNHLPSIDKKQIEDGSETTPLPASASTAKNLSVPSPAANALSPYQHGKLNYTLLLPPQQSTGLGCSHAGGYLKHEHSNDHLFHNDDFPALGVQCQDFPCTTRGAVMVGSSEAQSIFNNPTYFTPPIAAHHLSAKFMPFPDLCFIIQLMLRPLKSLDTYNDDYYYWSVTNSDCQNPPKIPSTVASNFIAQPTPVWKEIKIIAQENEENFHQTVKARARNFADKKKSLGQLVRSDVKRPKALLNAPVLSKDHTEKSLQIERATDTKYASGHNSRIDLWKARLSIDRGYTSFLSLIELRRLIQAHIGSPRLINALMVDVKTNVDLLHSSLGVIAIDVNEGKVIKVDKLRLSSALSLPKGRILCARVIEEGILPHVSACHILPEALHCILSSPWHVEGEDRLLQALTGLVLTSNPSIDPHVLCRCLDTSIIVSQDNKNDLSFITSSRMRMNLLYTILSVGKDVCAETIMNLDWSKKEQAFVKMLSHTS